MLNPRGRTPRLRIRGQRLKGRKGKGKRRKGMEFLKREMSFWCVCGEMRRD